MEEKQPNKWWFYLSFGLVLWTYFMTFFLSAAYKSSNLELLPTYQIPVCGIGYLLALRRNPYLAMGLAWGFAGILIFIFMFGCGGFVALWMIGKAIWDFFSHL